MGRVNSASTRKPRKGHCSLGRRKNKKRLLPVGTEKKRSRRSLIRERYLNKGGDSGQMEQEKRTTSHLATRKKSPQEAKTVGWGGGGNRNPFSPRREERRDRGGGGKHRLREYTLKDQAVISSLRMGSGYWGKLDFKEQGIPESRRPLRCRKNGGDQQRDRLKT